MSDNLRDRIAAVIAQHAVCMCGEWAENMTEQAQHQADAVIEALGMQVGAIAPFLIDGKKVTHNRYITSWEIVDE